MKRNYSYNKVKRCPKCHSSNLYKRVRTDRTDEGTTIKIYKCIKCRHEFDSPIIGEKEKANKNADEKICQKM